jgi:hypothetical protein
MKTKHTELLGLFDERDATYEHFTGLIISALRPTVLSAMSMLTGNAVDDIVWLGISLPSPDILLIEMQIVYDSKKASPLLLELFNDQVTDTPMNKGLKIAMPIDVVFESPDVIFSTMSEAISDIVDANTLSPSKLQANLEEFDATILTEEQMKQLAIGMYIDKGVTH